MSTAPRQRRSAEYGEDPLHAPAAREAGVATHEGDARGWSDSPRQLKQHDQISQLQTALTPGPASGAEQNGLPQALHHGMERLSGMDMSSIRVHRNSSKPASLQAHAYAQGTDIHLGPGQEKHLTHEAWHVVQQAQGRVQPTTQMAGTAVNTDPGLEHEADRMGQLAATTGQTLMRQTRTPSSATGGQQGSHQLSAPKPIHPWQAAAQRMHDPESGLSSGKGGERGVTVERPRHGASREIVQQSSAELLKLLKPLLAEFLTQIHYNSLEDAVGFVNYLDDLREEDEHLTPQQAYESGMPVSNQALDSVRGSQCMGQGMLIADWIAKRLHLHAYPVAAQFPGSTGAGHGAAMLKFANPEVEDDKGVILLDPGFNVAEPLVITQKTPAKLRAFNYSLSEDGSEVVSRDESDNVIVSFETVPVTNYDESVSRTAMLYYKTFVIKARGSNLNVVLQLDLRKETLEVTVGKKKKSASIGDLKAVQALISNEVAQALGYGESGAASLMESLNTVIRGKDDILNLQSTKATIAQ